MKNTWGKKVESYEHCAIVRDIFVALVENVNFQQIFIHIKQIELSYSLVYFYETF